MGVSTQLAFLAVQKRYGVAVVRARNLPGGDLDPNDVAQQLRRYCPVLVAVTHMPPNSGLVQPVVAIGELCRQSETWYLVDACQSVGQVVVDVQAIGCDFLNATGRKFLRGLRGSGFLYVSGQALQAGLAPLFIDRRGAGWTGPATYQPRPDGRRFEQQELAAPAVGLAEAVRYANAVGLPAIQTRNAHLAGYLRQQLARQADLRLLDQGAELSSIVTFEAPGGTLADVSAWLTAHRVAHSVSLKPYALLDFTRKQVAGAFRLSPHYFNTLAEIDQTADLLAAMPSR